MKTYTHVAKDGRYQFHLSDGSEVVVDNKGLATDDPVVIAHLDQCPFVKEQKKGSDG